MTEAGIYIELNKVFQEVLKAPGLAIKPSMAPDDVAGWDSTAMVALIMLTEERFAIEFTGREIRPIKNVADLVRLIAGKIP